MSLDDPHVEVDDHDDEDDFTDDIVRAKWTIDGATTLAEAAAKAREFADYLQSLHDEGWLLRMPVDSDYGFIYRPVAAGTK